MRWEIPLHRITGRLLIKLLLLSILPPDLVAHSPASGSTFKICTRLPLTSGNVVHIALLVMVREKLTISPRKLNGDG